eukprot:1342502-Prymnesium_polylepis.1
MGKCYTYWELHPSQDFWLPAARVGATAAQADRHVWRARRALPWCRRRPATPQNYTECQLPCSTECTVCHVYTECQLPCNTVCTVLRQSVNCRVTQCVLCYGDTVHTVLHGS